MTDRSNNIIMPVMEFLFSIISVLLMLPLVEQTAQEEYYRVIFIYLIRFVLKSISDKPKLQCLFLKTWSFVNLILGIMATALSFGLMSVALRDFLKDISPYINIVLFVCVILNLLCDFFELIVDLIKIRFAKRNFEKDMHDAFSE